MNFADQLIEATRKKQSHVCAGIDPVLSRLPEGLRVDENAPLDDIINAFRTFVLGVFEAVEPSVACVKLQSACFERYHAPGVALYHELVANAVARGLIVINDAKRGDIGISAEHYAAGLLADPSHRDLRHEVGPHAITINSYLGSDGIEPFVNAGRAQGKGAFALVRTSNPGGDAIQSLQLADGRQVVDAVAGIVRDLGDAQGCVGKEGYSLLGAVVGATKAADAARLRALMPRQIFLVPGFGAQGGKADDVKACFNADGHGAIVTASRSILYAFEKDNRWWQTPVGRAAADMKHQIAQIVDPPQYPGGVSMHVSSGATKAMPDVPTYQWTCVNDACAFAPRDGAGALTFNDRMWLLGGWNPGDKVNFPSICNSEVWSSTDGKDWKLETKQAPWEGRHTAGYAVHDGSMWIVGGDGNQLHYQNDVWRSDDGVNWTQVHDSIPWGPRILHYTVVHDGRIWIMGGQNNTDIFNDGADKFFNDVWCTENGRDWDRVVEHAPWPERGMIGGAAVKDGRIWLLGGGTYNTPDAPTREFRNDVWSTADGIDWTQHADGPWDPRQYHDVGVFDGMLWLCEGYHPASHNRNDVWFSPDGETWHEVPDTPWATRHAASVFTYDDGLWMVAGNNMTPDSWKLTRAD